MKHEMKTSLAREAEKIGRILSDPKQNKGNKTGQTYHTETVQPLSEDTAGIIYRKEPNKLKAAVFVFWTGDRWLRCTATDSQITGMLLFPFMKVKVERMNYELTHGQKS